MADLKKYLVKNPKQVLNYLNILSQERCLISAAFGADEKDTFLTAILDIDVKKQLISIDCGPKEYLNKKLLDSAIIKCSTEYQGIKVFFEGRKVKKAGNANQPSFLVPMPSALYWVQRRQFYRVKSPISKKSFCQVVLPKSETEEETKLNLKLFDISASGFSVLSESPKQSQQLVPNAQFENCKLVLEGEGELAISFEVRNSYPLNPNKPGKIQKIGCAILKISPRIEATIIRYMQNVEREIKQKS